MKYFRWNMGVVVCLFILMIIPAGMTLLKGRSSSAFISRIESWKFKTGDNTEWAFPQYDDSEWDEATWNGFIGDQTAGYAGPLWIRLNVRLRVNRTIGVGEDQLLHLGIIGDHQVFWDGVPLDRVSHAHYSRQSDGETLFASASRIPTERLTDGSHVIAVRVELPPRTDSRLLHYTLFGPLQDYYLWAVYHHPGDHADHAGIGFNKSEWRFVHAVDPTVDLPLGGGVRWLRFECIIPAGSKLLSNDSNQLVLGSLGSHEVYWDGRLIGRAGIPGETEVLEVAGPYLSVHSIPGALVEPGKHEVAIRYSQQFSLGKSLLNYINIMSPGRILDLAFSLSAKAAIPMGLALMTSLFFGYYYFSGERRVAHLVLSAFCLTMSIILLLHLIPHGSFLPYSRISTIECLNYALVVVGCMLLLTFHLLLFSIPGKPYWLVPTFLYLSLVALPLCSSASVPMLSRLGDPATLSSVAVISLCATTCVMGIRKGIEGAWWALFGICLILSMMLGMKLSGSPVWDGSIIYFAFGGHMCCLVLSTVSEAHAWRRNYLRAQVAKVQLELNKTRLEAELSKKTIQPHFIMNTLTSLMEWVEKDPERSVDFIEALAAEFRLASELSGETLIPLSREIELCRSFLELMSFQQNLDYGLNVCLQPEALIGTLHIPPYLLQTLAENGITHNASAVVHGFIQFTLKVTHSVGTLDIVFQTPFLPETFPPDRRSDDDRMTLAPEPMEGTGLTYVKARLQESYGDAWSFSHGPGDGLWETHITLKIP